MVEMFAEYTGELHCAIKHEPSGAQIATDAPKDNQGKGEAFSPTDLVGAALASCILTTLAIVGNRDGVELKGAKARVKKEMNPSPRRIASLSVEIDMPPGVAKDKRAKLEHIAHTCPVSRSLSPDVAAPVIFNYPD